MHVVKDAIFVAELPVTSINLQYNEIGDAGLAILAKTIKVCSIYDLCIGVARLVSLIDSIYFFKGLSGTSQSEFGFQ